LQHHSLVVIPQPRQVVGLVYQQLSVRQPAPAGERSAQRKQRQRESELWLKGIALGPGTGRLLLGRRRRPRCGHL